MDNILTLPKQTLNKSLNKPKKQITLKKTNYVDSLFSKNFIDNYFI